MKIEPDEDSPIFYKDRKDKNRIECNYYKKAQKRALDEKQGVEEASLITYNENLYVAVIVFVFYVLFNNRSHMRQRSVAGRLLPKLEPGCSCKSKVKGAVA